MALAELLSDGNGETSVSPSPPPTSISTSVTTVATKAPAMTGAQLTAEADDSTGASTAMVEVLRKWTGIGLRFFGGISGKILAGIQA